MIRSGSSISDLHVRAVGAVHRDAAAARDEADDLVAGHRRAALRELDEDVGRAAHEDAGVAAAGLARAADVREVDRPGRRVVRADERGDLLDDGLRGHVPLADRGVQRRDVLVLERAARPR